MTGEKLHQQPDPGARLVRHRGDVLRFELRFDASHGGGRSTSSHRRDAAAWLRTNLGRGNVRRAAIVDHVDHVDHDRPLRALDWHDLPMQRTESGCFAVTAPLTEVGRFEAKAFLLPDGESEPIWPAGGNVVIKVEPAYTVCANTIYTAFVRQFATAPESRHEPHLRALDEAGYAAIPPSGKFRDLIARLDVVINTMRFRIVQLLPIFRTPTTYARMGRFGSPFAALDFFDVDPALAQFDRRTTPLEQFGELVDAVHARAARIFLDIPVNHTGWASRLQNERPDWFVRRRDQSFKSPGAWGTTWEDLSELDYANHGLWRYMADVFEFWCERGVDGFRCDAGYMVPRDAWEYIVARVRRQFPDTVFLLEGLGGPLHTTDELLDLANLDWAYSELFQQYSREQIEWYLPRNEMRGQQFGPQVHFAETHDNDRLAARSRGYATMRTALAALSSDSGCFGITAGVEWFCPDKILVHGSPPLRWGAEPNQVAALARLNALLEWHPAFHPGAQVRLVHTSTNQAVAIHRRPAPERGAAAGVAGDLWIAVNLDDTAPNTVRWPLATLGAGVRSGEQIFTDLITQESVAVALEGPDLSCALQPAEVRCLTLAPVASERLAAHVATTPRAPSRVELQRARAKVLEACAVLDEPGAWLDVDPGVARLLEDPRGFIEALAPPGRSPITEWRGARDLRRCVPVPPGDFVLFQCTHPFRLRIVADGCILRQEESLRCSAAAPMFDPGAADGTAAPAHFALLTPLPVPQRHGLVTVELVLYEPGGTRHCQGTLLRLTPVEEVRIATGITPPSMRDAAAPAGPYGVLTNGRGGYSQVRAAYAEIESQYDAVLTANLHPRVPGDQRVLLTRCRAWLVHQGYSQELGRACLREFVVESNTAVRWSFQVPVGCGLEVGLTARLIMRPGENRVQLTWQRLPSTGSDDRLPDDRSVRLIVRPDLEHRGHHEKTKAYTGPERGWPAAIRLGADAASFVFAPSHQAALHVMMSGGGFVSQPEWHYMVPHRFERDRGLDDCSDLFSPGYFEATLRDGETAVLDAYVAEATTTATTSPAGQQAAVPCERTPILREALRVAMQQFVVRRDAGHTVMAGYPWFLDWGRDTLIALRGMIAAGMLDTARGCLVAFASLERDGTLPNMLAADDASNRDTSDAPLWLMVACRDWLRAHARARHAGVASLSGGLSPSFDASADLRDTRQLLGVDCDGRRLEEVLLSIGRHYVAGTPNGIRMDPESGLVFSPSHFTWMDTAHPAGTPRQGYPIEIQALWWAALDLLNALEPAGPWEQIGLRVRASLDRYFVRRETAGSEIFLADCLHAASGKSAAAAIADDALRPNQLLAVTLGAVTAPDVQRGIVRACEELLLPGAIRSLADRAVGMALPIRRGGVLLNDPLCPYWGQYTGDEDTRRKPAYHNGTGWTWLFPSYAEASVIAYGGSAIRSARALLASSAVQMNQGCIGQIPEVVDGDSPHAWRGCGAQAWGVTELYRVLDQLA